MERTTIEEAKLIFKDNFIGPDELLPLFLRFHPKEKNEYNIPEIPWNSAQLEILSDDYILILGIPSWGGIDINIRNLRVIFGVDPNISEPCFYNQDWYLNENFIDTTLKLGWYLVKRNVFEESRAVDPTILVRNDLQFPPTILCCYTFFALWLARDIKLWQYDFVWCSDKDHNGDRIYVGKYTDIDGVNKSGFSIHRHLALRRCYTAIDFLTNNCLPSV